MSHVPDRANHPNRTGFSGYDPGMDRLFSGLTGGASAEPTFFNSYTQKNEVVPEEHREWHSRDPQAFASWKAHADSIDAAGEAMSKALGRHHETFSWDNPNHYLNK